MVEGIKGYYDNSRIWDFHVFHKFGVHVFILTAMAYLTAVHRSCLLKAQNFLRAGYLIDHKDFKLSK